MKNTDPCTYYSSGAVDGVLLSKSFINCAYKTYLSLASSGGYWEVDLGSSQTITRVVYYNRADCCNSRATANVLTLLNAARSVVCSSSTFTSDYIQDFTLIACTS